MTSWLLAVAAGLVLAAVAYAGRASGRRAPLGVLAAVLRALAATLLVALLLDAPAGAARAPRPLVALDVSASWTRGGGEAWRAARAAAERLAGSDLLLVGDSARTGKPPEEPTDLASSVRPAVERALAAGRPLVLVTDGEVDGAEVLDRLPAGSEVRVGEREAVADLAAVALDAPSAAVGGDTLAMRARVAAGAAGAAAGELRLLLDAETLATAPMSALDPFSERTVELTAVMPRREGVALLRLVTAATGDQEPRNDTVAVPIELSTIAGVTVISTAPDFDVRYMLDVLRGTVSLPSRAYLQVAPGQWRQEGSLAPVGAEMVRDAARRAPILVLHGDTSFFGAPTSVGRGALLLAPAPATSAAEWYAVGAPPSPLASLLSGVAWDSLPPLAVGTRAPAGEWVGLVARRGRGEERQPLVAGSEEPRRRVVVGVGGLWRWRFRGGASRDAFDALWGGIFDWLAAERRDQRAALPEHALLRAGDPVRWRRGGADSVVAVTLHRRGDAARAAASGGGTPGAGARAADASGADSIALELRFPAGASVVTTPPLAAGVYDVRIAGGGSAGGGSAVVAVNASRELLPRRPSVAAGPVGRAPAATGVAPTVRSLPWLFVLAALLLCAEWLVRRRVGMR